MIQHQGIYLPDGEKHLVEWMTKSGELVDGRGSYQIKKYRAAIAMCRDFRTAVDVGAHVGLWSMQLAKSFYLVHAFEPVPAHQSCFLQNLYGKDNVRLHDCALGEKTGFVKMDTAPTSSGDTRVSKEYESEGEGRALMATLDGFFLPDVDFIKLDCEGYELHALKGAAETIRRCLPVIIVEQKPGRAQRFGLPETGAVQWLEETFSYKCAKEMSGDFIMVQYGGV